MSRDDQATESESQGKCHPQGEVLQDKRSGVAAQVRMMIYQKPGDNSSCVGLERSGLQDLIWESKNLGDRYSHPGKRDNHCSSSEDFRNSRGEPQTEFLLRQATPGVSARKLL